MISGSNVVYRGSQFQAVGDVKLGEFVIIERDVVIGDKTTVGDYVKLVRGTEIGDNATIGSFVRTGSNCKIGTRSIVKAGAIISPDTIIGEDVFIGPKAVILHSDFKGNHSPAKIGDRVKIGAGAIIGPGVEIGPDISIGANSFVPRSLEKPGIYIGNPVKIMNETLIEPGVHLDNKGNIIHKTALISPTVFLGYYIKIRPNVFIDETSEIRDHCFIGEGVSIGSQTKVFQFSNIGAYTEIGKGVYVGPRVTITNDKILSYLRVEKFVPQPVKVGDFARIGSCCCVCPGVSIGKNAVIGAGSVVTKDIPEGEIWTGNPARKLRDVDTKELLD